MCVHVFVCGACASPCMYVCMCVCACSCACMRARAHACVLVCLRALTRFNKIAIQGTPQMAVD